MKLRMAILVLAAASFSSPVIEAATAWRIGPIVQVQMDSHVHVMTVVTEGS
jgi:hypothetical protein